MVRAVLAYQEHGVEFFQLLGQSWIGLPELSTFFDPKKGGEWHQAVYYLQTLNCK